MELLTNWITQIIIFILLATIIDLLIPNVGMKKYIKLVIGLVLILILLKPIFSLFNFDVERNLDQTYSTLFEENGMTESVEESIELQKSEIEMTQDAYILEEMAVQLKLLANESLRELHQAEIKEILFVFYDEVPGTYDDLEEVIVYLQDVADGEEAIETIEKVVIDMNAEEVTEGNEEIIQLLRDVWELIDKEITVHWEGGTS